MNVGGGVGFSDGDGEAILAPGHGVTQGGCVGVAAVSVDGGGAVGGLLGDGVGEWIAVGVVASDGAGDDPLSGLDACGRLGGGTVIVEGGLELAEHGGQ